MKIAFVFSGQGAQYPSMFQDLYQANTHAKAVFDLADRTLGRGISWLCFEGTQEELNLTHNTQPCVLAADLAAGEALLGAGVRPAAAAGFSLGEYAALTLAGVLAKEDVFPLIQLRADAMQDAVPAGEGAMAAIVGLPSADVAVLCAQITDDYVIAANFNAPVQTVISGTAKGVAAASALAREAGAAVMPLKVSAPFHCELMKPAADALEKALAKLSFGTPSLPVYMNVTAAPLPSAEAAKELLFRQAYSPVQWVQTIRSMYDDGIDTFIECGPGKTLSGLVKKTLKGCDVRIMRVENRETLEDTLSRL